MNQSAPPSVEELCVCIRNFITDQKENFPDKKVTNLKLGALLLVKFGARLPRTDTNHFKKRNDLYNAQEICNRLCQKMRKQGILSYSPKTKWDLAKKSEYQVWQEKAAAEEKSYADMYRKEFKEETDIFKLQDVFRIKMAIHCLLKEIDKEKYDYKNGFPEVFVNQVINFALQEGERRGKKKGMEEAYEQARQDILDRI